VKKLPDSTGLTELTEDIIKAIAAADHEEEATIGLRVVTYVGSITGSAVLLSAQRNIIYIIGLITSR
jgi:hypothetical protein